MDYSWRQIMKKLCKKIFLLILLFFSFFGFSQSLTGTIGYFNIPSGDLLPDKTFYTGFNRVSKNYQVYAGGEYDLNIFYATLTYIEFLEIGLRYTRLDGFKPPDRKQAGDRMAILRIRPVKEGKFHPSVVIGLQNFITTINTGEASHFNSSYLVLTKNFNCKYIFESIGITAGYGFDIMRAADYQFIGFFGGIRLIPKIIKNTELFFEYDADKFNTGTRVLLFNHFSIMAGFEGFDSFSGGISYRFQLP